MTRYTRADVLDTFHAAVLFVGLVAIVNHGFAQNWPILPGLVGLALWTGGYWLFVKRVLPPRWSGQT